ncbi:MAG: Hpt domain-containing protein [bacterium]|nr:Hpt domain-containing protein [bacterium]
MNDYVSKPLRPADLFDAIFRVSGVAPGEVLLQPPTDVAHPEEVGIPVFDRATALERMDGDEELLAELVALFLTDVPARMQELRQALTAAEVDKLERIAHGIKGAAANLGAEAMRAAALALEQIGRAADLGAAPAGLTQLEEELGRLRDALAGSTE